MTIRAIRVLNLDRRYEPGEEIPRQQLGTQARRLRDTGHIQVDREEELLMPDPAPDEITDRRLDPDFHELAPAAQEKVLQQQVSGSATPSIHPTPQAGAEILAQATAPDPAPNPAEVEAPQSQAEAELKPAEHPASEVQTAEPTGGLSDPTGEGDPNRAAAEAEEDQAAKQEQLDQAEATSEELKAENPDAATSTEPASDNPADEGGRRRRR
jgi:hypothetical protein